MSQQCSARCRAVWVTTGLYIFPGLGVGKNATREEKNETMKQMQQRIAANRSGILNVSCRPVVSSHLPNRSLVQFSTEVLQAILVIWLLAQTRIGSFDWTRRFRSGCRNPGRNNDQRFLLELVRLPGRLHRQVILADRDCGFCSAWSRCGAGVAKAWSCSLKLLSFITRSAVKGAHCQCRPTI